MISPPHLRLLRPGAGRDPVRGRQYLRRRRIHHRAAGPHRERPVHPQPRHPQHPRQAARAGDAQILLFARCRPRAMPRPSAYAKRVRDLLQEYAALSPRQADPAGDRSRALHAGRRPGQRRRAHPAPRPTGGDVVYFGLVGTNSIDGRQTIPFFAPDRESYLEYDLTSLIYHSGDAEKAQSGADHIAAGDGLAAKSAAAGAPTPRWPRNMTSPIFPATSPPFRPAPISW